MNNATQKLIELTIALNDAEMAYALNPTEANKRLVSSIEVEITILFA